MAAAPAAISLAATGFKVAGDFMGGSAKATGDAYQAQSLENAAQIGEIKASETGTQLTSSLQQSIGNIRAVRASANTDPNSPTGQAIVARAQALGDTRTKTQVGNILAQVEQDKAGSALYEKAASSDLLSGYLGGAGDILTGLGPKSGGSPLAGVGLIGTNNLLGPGGGMGGY